MFFPNIKVVLVNTSHPGNIGAVARAMKNMCIAQLCLVQPNEFPHASATARASGADDILENASLFDTLEDALIDCQIVFGVSARERSVSWPTVGVRESATMVNTISHQNRIAFIFGCEHSGLTNSEMDLCHYLVKIPSNPNFSSLNLGAAAQIVFYELYMVAGIHENSEVVSLEEPKSIATVKDMESFYDHLECTLLSVGFLHPDQPGQIMRRLRRLFGRIQLEKRELNIFRGILAAIISKTRTN